MNKNMPGELGEWLSYLDQINPNRIELGLGRVLAVLKQLDLDFGKAVIIEVAGTNGKGSSCALLDATLRAAGYSSCLYTSPHLHRFNERIVINGQQASDDQLCEAFAAVEAARGELFLTYFEFTTLAAFYLFAKNSPDFLVLEIGLGGRLDAVNALNADIALITSIGLDHVRILGSTLEQIAFEKGGIIKPGALAVVASCSAGPAAVFTRLCQERGVRLYLQGRDFSAQKQEDGALHFSFGLTDTRLPPSRVPEVCVPAVICVLRLIEQKGFVIPDLALCAALLATALPGRGQLVARSPDIYLDVGHNPQAAQLLAERLAKRRPEGRRLVVIGMLRDKDVEGVLSLLINCFDDFYLCSLPGERGERAQRLQQALIARGRQLEMLHCYADPAQACAAALAGAEPSDEIVVCGSFVTVAAADDYLRSQLGQRYLADPV